MLPIGSGTGGTVWGGSAMLEEVRHWREGKSSTASAHFLLALCSRLLLLPFAASPPATMDSCPSGLQAKIDSSFHRWLLGMVFYHRTEEPLAQIWVPESGLLLWCTRPCCVGGGDGYGSFGLEKPSSALSLMGSPV